MAKVNSSSLNITVHSLRDSKSDKPWRVKVDRSSVLGNPFTMGADGKDESKRDEVCELYHKYLTEAIRDKDEEISEELNRLFIIFRKYKKLELFCWCAPKRCHGDSIKQIIEEAIFKMVEKKKADAIAFANRPEFRIIVAGSRNFKNYELLKYRLDGMLKAKIKTHKIVIVSGGARGADSLGEQYAQEHGFEIRQYLADWENKGKSAGYIRNAKMAANADALMLFWDGESPGSRHMLNLAEKKKLAIRVEIYDK